jgi:hypothetical protein
MNLTASLGVSASTFLPDEMPATAPAAPEVSVDAPRRKERPKGSKNDVTRTDFVQFVVWAARLNHFPMPDQVMTRFPHAHPATAHRWLNHLALAMNVDRPKRNAHGDIVVPKGDA